MFTLSVRYHALQPSRAPLALMLGIFLLATFGCRTAQDNQFDILERELRTQEDYIYELEDYVNEYSQKLRQYRLAQSSSSSSSSYESNSIVKSSRQNEDIPEVEPLRIDEEPLIETPEENDPPALKLEETDPDEIKIPELEISYVDPSDPSQVSVELWQSIPEPIADEHPVPLVEHQPVVTAEHREESPAAPMKPADRIAISRLFHSEASETSPKTLLAVVETFNADNLPVEFPGEVSLMVMTGGEGRPQRLKRWDFDPEDAATAWQSSHLGDGLHLELPLGDTELPAVALEMWVRIVDENGRKLLTQLPFERKRLAALEMETGAQELLAEDPEPTAERLAVAGTEELVAAEQPVAQPSGWKAAAPWSEIESESSASSVITVSGWTSQPAGGRFPELGPAPPKRPAASGIGPVWKAGRVNRTPVTSASRESQPQWSAWR